MLAEKLAKILLGKDYSKTVVVEGQEFVIRIPSFIEEAKILLRYYEVLQDMGCVDKENAPAELAVMAQAVATLEIVLEDGAGLYEQIKNQRADDVFQGLILPLWVEYQKLREEVNAPPEELKNS